MGESELFQQGKIINIVLSIAVLAGLLLIFLKYLPFFQAILLAIILEITLFVFKAPYLQAEISYYFLSFCSYLLFLSLILRPSWPLALAAGLVTALAYLTKGTVLLSIPIFTFFYLAKILVDGYQVHRREGHWSAKELLQKGLYLALFIVVFIGLIFPYIHSMKERFNRYFYNVNTTVYIWLDNWDQAVEYEKKFRFAERWPTELAADQIPGPWNYLKSHNIDQIKDRLLAGIGNVSRNLLYQYSIINYPAVYLLILGLIMTITWGEVRSLVRRYPFVILFTVTFFILHLAAFSWYAPIAGGRRFTYTLQIPLLFSVFVAINEIVKTQAAGLQASGRDLQTTSSGRLSALSNIIVATTLTYITWLILNYILFFDRYGS